MCQTLFDLALVHGGVQYREAPPVDRFTTMRGADALPGLRILVVEDDGAVLELLEETFELDGLEVSTASSGDQALRKLEAGPLPDMVVLDMNMPGIHGTEVLRRMKSDPRWADIPVAAISGSERAEFRLAAEPDAFLSKPFDMEALTDTLARLHRAREERRPLQLTDAITSP